MQQLPFDLASTSVATILGIAVVALWRDRKEREKADVDLLTKCIVAIEATGKALTELRGEVKSLRLPNDLT